MSRLAETFAALRSVHRTALVTYITAGDPDKNITVPLMHVLVEAGADVLELGVPFSDPTADGPVIQGACERALRHGTTLADVLGMVNQFRQTDAHTPVVLMGYLNPVEAMGAEKFAAAAAQAGVDGVLTVDMPPEEAEPLTGLLKARGLDSIFLLSPTSSRARLKRICETASGFVYYVSLKGVTGAASLDVQDVRDRLTAIRRETRLPMGVGFGVRDAHAAAQLAGFADAVIVGSALVSRIAEQHGGLVGISADLREFVHGLRTAMDGVRRTEAVNT